MNAPSSRKYRVSTLACLAIALWFSLPARADSIFAMAAPALTYTESVSSLYTMGTFTDSDPTLQAGDFTVSINWGDGSGATAGFITSNGPGFDVQAAHTYAEEGTYNPQLTFLNPVSGANGSALDLAVVADAPLDAGSFLSPLSQEGSPMSGALANFQDENTLASFSDFTATVNWGDGIVTAASVVSNGGGQFSIVGDHTYAEQGTYSVTASVNDIGGSSVSMEGSVVVGDAPVFGTGNVFAANAGVSFTGIVATFVDANPFGLSSDFASTVDWGDGTVTAASIVASGGLFDVVGTHTYAGPGTFSVTTQANDFGGSNATMFGSADVSNPASVPEPASWLSAAAGLAFLFHRKWRGSRSASRSKS